MPARPQFFRRLVVLFGLVAFWTYESAFFVLVRPPPSDAGEFRVSDPVARAANILVLLGALFLLAWSRGSTRFLWRHAKLPALVLLYCFASALWSIDPEVTLRRAVSLSTCFLFGYAALLTFGPRGTIRVYGWSLFLAALASWAALLVFHGRVFDNDAVATSQAIRSFHGIFTQKNELSVEMLMGFCCWAYLGVLQPRRDEIERRLWPVAMAIILAAMAYAKGATSILAALLAALAVVGLRWPGWRMRLALSALIAAALLVTAAVLLVEPGLLFGLLGKEPSMTGRLPLWIDAARAVAERPLLGWGYNAFWTPESIGAQYIWQRIGWPAPNAHNGLLELGLDFGLLGAALYAAMLLRIAARTLQALGDPVRPEAKYLALIALAMLVESLDEGTTGWPDALAMLVAYAYATTSTWRAEAATSRRVAPVRSPAGPPPRAPAAAARRVRTARPNSTPT